MAGMTSQPSMNALVAALRGSEHDALIKNKELQPLADYWEGVREYYRPFECGLKSSTAEVYYHEIPGGQYSNLRPQVASLGLLDRWADVKHAFAVVNQLVGDIPKVTPSSKMVGDFATFVVQQDLLEMHHADLDASVEATRRNLLDNAAHLDFPQSVVQYFRGELGHPPGGFPEDLRKAVLKGLPVCEGRPGDDLEPLDFDALAADLAKETSRKPRRQEVISAALYPRVLRDHLAFHDRYGDVSKLDTPSYFYGLEPGRDVWVELEAGKTLLIRLDAVSDADEDGVRTVYFTLNGQGRPVGVTDRSLASEVDTGRKADPADPGQVGAPMPGKIVSIAAKEGDTVEEGDPILTLEAMKMETVVRAPRAGLIVEIFVREGQTLAVADLVAVIADG